MGVVYYANYLRYYEAARVEWLRAHDIPYKQIEEDGALFPVIEAHTRYRQPARFDDLLDIHCTLTKVGSASLRFEYVVRRDDTVLAGFAAQDPGARVVGPRLSREPYGIGAKAGSVDLVRHVNAVIEQAFADGTWQLIYRIAQRFTVRAQSGVSNSIELIWSWRWN